ncbi:sodium-dependent transporter [Thiorhodospira sibirica]|uniref:sodium-dependent transporter n=1 Tax=Thiorhodospira sibirica TaxID=154347 RepID=UPI00022C4042|nr:sodium-dependent transporter [Thiorhodospira sibirica]
MIIKTSIHGQWSSRVAFILAATGSAVGLGNIWRFPYIAGENGGGAFVLVYLLCILLLGLPIMIAEIMLGRRGRQSPINTMLSLARDEGRSPLWGGIGWLGVVTGFFILSFYSVIAGWTLAYLFRAGGASFAGLDAEGVSALFTALISDPEKLLAWHTIFMIMTVMVVARGVQSGLEKAVKLLMPGLLVVLVLLVGYAAIEGNFWQGFAFMFRPDFASLTTNSILLAMGQAFFTLSLGMGAIMAYGSYLSSQASIVKTAAVVVSADTLVALLAGLAIFPIVFASALEPAQGPGLIFVTLPLAFAQMPGGTVFATLFFTLLVLAAWTSAISIMEPATAWLAENHEMDRAKAASIIGGVAWFLGIGSILSFSLWANYTFLGMTFFDTLDYLTSNILLPLGGFLIALFVGFKMKISSVQEELAMRQRWLFYVWYYLVRFVAPIAIALIFLRAVGLI